MSPRLIRPIKTFRWIAVLVFALAAGGCSVAQDGAIIRANNAIAVRRYDFALTRLSAAEGYRTPTPQQQAQISFLRGRCYEGLGRLPEAIGSYQFVTEKFPDTIYAFQARERLKVLRPQTRR